MKLTALLQEAQILTGFSAPDKWAAIGTLLDTLVEGGRIPRELREHAMEALVAREKVASTGMEHGVALPHAGIEGLVEPAAALGIAPGGLAFESADGAPARLIALLVIPRPSGPQHVRALATLAGLLSGKTTRQSLIAALDPQKAFKIVQAVEKKSESRKPPAPPPTTPC